MHLISNVWWFVQLKRTLEPVWEVERQGRNSWKQHFWEQRRLRAANTCHKPPPMVLLCRRCSGRQQNPSGPRHGLTRLQSQHLSCQGQGITKSRAVSATLQDPVSKWTNKLPGPGEQLPWDLLSLGDFPKTTVSATGQNQWTDGETTVLQPPRLVTFDFLVEGRDWRDFSGRAWPAMSRGLRCLVKEVISFPVSLLHLLWTKELSWLPISI